MRLLEYKSKEILVKNGIPIPSSVLVSDLSHASFPLPAVLKAQVPIGGRQKAGGVVEVQTRQEAEAHLQRLLSSEVRGHPVESVLIEERVETTREFYLGITVDTVAKKPIAIFSTEGGIEVEETSKKNPNAVLKRHFPASTGLPEFRAREMISQCGIRGRLLLRLSATLSRLSAIFTRYDATISEINPLAQTAGGKVIALDCHMELDDDALFRHATLATLSQKSKQQKGHSEKGDFEKKAAEIDRLDQRGVAGRLIAFDGDLGLIIGGGGASLTAFDAVLRHEGRPANYCEIGGNPSVLKTKELTKLILSKPGVEKLAVIMNIVSNTRVDLMARGVIKGILESGRVPSETLAVFRIPGAWEEEGFKILRKYGVEYCDRTVSIDEAARIAVEKTRGNL